MNSKEYLQVKKENHAESQLTSTGHGLTFKPYHHQIPPYGKSGTPYIITKYDLAHQPSNEFLNNNNIGERNSKSSFQLNWPLLQKKNISEKLETCFPFVYVISHCLWVLLNSLIQIALQISLMATNGALWWVGAGIWGGVYFIIMGLLTLLLVRVRNYWLFVLTYIMHIIGIFVAVGAYLIVNIIGIDEYRELCSYFPNCFNISVKVLSYLLFWFGVVLIIFLLVYIIIMPFWIMDILNEYSQYKNKKNLLASREQKINNNNLIEDELAKHSSLYVQTNLDYA